MITEMIFNLFVFIICLLDIKLFIYINNNEKHIDTNIIKKINSFNSIDIIPNTLIISDIDETVLYFSDINKKWWDNKIDIYMKKYNDLHLANLCSIDDWSEYVSTNNPKHTDKTGFENMLRKINKTKSNLIFLTARSEKFRDLTYHHLNFLNINSLDYEIHFLSDYPKGDYIKDKINLENYDRIIFIDDLEKNIESVIENFNDRIITYQFQLKH